MTMMTRRLIDYPPHRPFTIGQLLGRLGETIHNLGQSPSDASTAPAITQHCDRYGNVYWHVYDAKTGRNVYCMSTEEVSLWLNRAVYRL